VKTVVSVTPLAVSRDSRTFKQAASMSRLGYRSIVVEGEPSAGLPTELPFELITVGAPAEPAVELAATGNLPQPDAAPAQRLRLSDHIAMRSPTWFRRLVGPVWRLRRAPRTLLRRVGGGVFLQPLSFWAYVRHYVAMCRSVAVALPPADLYYVHSQQQFPAVWWRGRFGRIPHVYDAHDLYWTLREDGRRLTPADRGIWLIWDLVERICARRAQGCVTVGDDVAKLADERFRRSFVVVRNAHDERLDEDGAPDLRRVVALPEEGFLLAVSGNFKRGMAVEQMLRALADLPERVHVAFIGRNYTGFGSVAGELGVGGRAHFLPPLAPTRIVPFLSGADAAPVLYYPSSPSVARALPNGFFHAVAAGVPVLYPRRLTELRALSARHQLGWEIDPQSETSIATAVRSLLDWPAELARRREHVRTVRHELSWTGQEEVLGHVVAAALNGRGGG
jgi:hypothetical protein